MSGITHRKGDAAGASGNPGQRRGQREALAVQHALELRVEVQPGLSADAETRVKNGLREDGGVCV